MKTILFRSLVITLLLLQTGCAAMALKDWATDGNSTNPGTDIATLATLQQLINQQPGQTSLKITFEQHSTVLERKDMQALRDWLTVPVSDVEIKVGPVRHDSVIQAITISRERGLRVSRLLNTFRIPVRVSYDPTLPLNTVEVFGWL